MTQTGQNNKKVASETLTGTILTSEQQTLLPETIVSNFYQVPSSSSPSSIFEQVPSSSSPISGFSSDENSEDDPIDDISLDPITVVQQLQQEV